MQSSPSQTTPAARDLESQASLRITAAARSNGAQFSPSESLVETHGLIEGELVTPALPAAAREPELASLHAPR